MSGTDGNEGRVSGLAVAAAIVGGLWLIGLYTYAVGAGIATILIYATLCSFYPMEKCTRCEGGKVWNEKRSHFRGCKKCDGKGFHVRWGRRVWDKRVTGD